MPPETSAAANGATHMLLYCISLVYALSAFRGLHAFKQACHNQASGRGQALPLKPQVIAQCPGGLIRTTR